MEVKQELDLTTIEETKKPLKELTPFMNNDGEAVAFEEGESLMVIVTVGEKVYKKRINRKHFKQELH